MSLYLQLILNKSLIYIIYILPVLYKLIFKLESKNYIYILKLEYIKVYSLK